MLVLSRAAAVLKQAAAVQCRWEADKAAGETVKEVVVVGHTVAAAPVAAAAIPDSLQG
jgi:hypothetical protein